MGMTIYAKVDIDRCTAAMKGLEKALDELTKGTRLDNEGLNHDEDSLWNLARRSDAGSYLSMQLREHAARAAAVLEGYRELCNSIDFGLPPGVPVPQPCTLDTRRSSSIPSPAPVPPPPATECPNNQTKRQGVLFMRQDGKFAVISEVQRHVGASLQIDYTGDINDATVVSKILPYPWRENKELAGLIRMEAEVETTRQVRLKGSKK